MGAGTLTRAFWCKTAELCGGKKRSAFIAARLKLTDMTSLSVIQQTTQIHRPTAVQPSAYLEKKTRTFNIRKKTRHEKRALWELTKWRRDRRELMELLLGE